MERYGDPQARRWIGPKLERKGVPITIIVIVFAAGVISFALWRSLEDGVQVRIVGVAIGLAVAALILVALIALWSRYWQPLKQSVRQTSRAHVTSLVVGARMPRLTEALFTALWPTALAPVPRPQHVVLLVDSDGISVLNARQPSSLIASLPWSTVADVRHVEYVEGDRAYEGIAVIGPTEVDAAVFQIVSFNRRGVSFPRGLKLDVLTQSILSRRPSTAD